MTDTEILQLYQLSPPPSHSPLLMPVTSSPLVVQYTMPDAYITCMCDAIQYAGSTELCSQWVMTLWTVTVEGNLTDATTCICMYTHSTHRPSAQVLVSGDIAVAGRSWMHHTSSGLRSDSQCCPVMRYHKCVCTMYTNDCTVHHELWLKYPLPLTRLSVNH